MSLERLEGVYYDPKHPAGYTSVDALFRHAKGLKRKEVKTWLSGQDTYTLHKPIRKKFPRRVTITKGLHHQWQADLAILADLAAHNDGYKYILTVVDVFSRYGIAEPLKTKTGVEVARALKTIFDRHGGKTPSLLQVDQGSEFYNAHVQGLLKTLGIRMFSVYSDPKASLVERWNRTLKNRLYKYFTKNNTKRYVDVLPDVVQAYNASTHRILGMAPRDVNEKNQKLLWTKLYGKEFPRRAKFHFNVGDTVRISKLRGTFGRGYLPQWSEEYFLVTHRRATKPNTYKIKDLNDEPVKGSFYREELQRIRPPAADQAYKVDVIKERRRRGRREYYVHYRGWPSSFDEWLPARQLERLV